MRFSPSTLSLWMACPLQAKFAKILKFERRQNAAATFGSIVHKALEGYNAHGDVDQAIDDFKLWWKEPDRLGLEPDYWPKYTSYSSYQNKGIEILQNYHEKVKWEKRTVIATEHRFLVPCGEHELTGIVDLIELKKAGNGKLTLRCVDYKTASRQPIISALRLNIQFTIYMYAMEQPEFWLGNGPDFPGIPDGADWFEKLKKAQRRAIWYHLATTKEINAGDRDDGDFLRMYRLLTEVANAVEKDVFVPNISGDTCILCDFTRQCGIQIPDDYSPDSELVRA